LPFDFNYRTKVVRPQILSKFLDTYFCHIPDISRKALIFNTVIFQKQKPPTLVQHRRLIKP